MNATARPMSEDDVDDKAGTRPGDRAGFRHDEPPPILGSSPAAQAMRAFVRRWAPATGAKILLTGESGTGKDLVARHLHYGSPRRDGPFVAVNCAGIPASLAESEFFGHQKGAFTGASSTRHGYFELADRGTLFLDEVGELAPTVQAKLLRVIQDLLVFRVGGHGPIRVDVRIIAATNRDPASAVAEGRFRDDLYSRLRTLEYRLPALRERPEDIPELAAHFLEAALRRIGRPPKRLGPAAIDCLRAYSWPRNVRELEQEMERAAIASEGPEVEPGDLDANVRDVAKPGEPAETQGSEALRILSALRQTRGNLTAAAALLGVHRTTLWRRMRELRIKKDFALRPPPDSGWLFQRPLE